MAPKKRRISATSAPPAGKRAKLEGISAPGENRYRKVTPSVRQTSRKVWRPSNGTDLNRDSIVTFSLKTNSNEIVRFPDDPFYLLFSATVVNQEHKTALAANTIGGAKAHFLVPKEDKPGVYFDPTLAGQSLFSRIEVLVNGQALEGPSLEEFVYLLQKINRTMTTDGVRKPRYGSALSTISNTEERTYADAKSIRPRLQRAMDSLTFDSQPTSKDLLTQFSFDGLWPFSFQTNMTRAIFGAIENGYLPPSVELNIRVHKRSPIDMAVERPKISDDTYYDPEAVAEDAAVTPITWTLKDFFIVYESTVLEEGPELKALRENTMRYLVDVPKIRLAQLSAGMRHTSNTVDVPKGTKLVLLAWLMEDQVFYNPTSKKNISARMTFPRDCTNAQFLMKGHSDPLIFAGGLEDIGLDKSFHSASCRAYHAGLVRKGLYGRDLDSMFPQKGLSYDQIILLDLTQRDLRENTELEVVLLFGSQFSPKKTYMFATTIQQGQYTYSKAEPMKFEILV